MGRSSVWGNVRSGTMGYTPRAAPLGEEPAGEDSEPRGDRGFVVHLSEDLLGGPQQGGQYTPAAAGVGSPSVSNVMTVCYKTQEV